MCIKIGKIFFLQILLLIFIQIKITAVILFDHQRVRLLKEGALTSFVLLLTLFKYLKNDFFKSDFLPIIHSNRSVANSPTVNVNLF